LDLTKVVGSLKMAGLQSKTKSAVWEFFNKKDAETCTCHVCKCEVKKPKSNTSNLVRHLERHHKREFQEYQRLQVLHEQEQKQNNEQPKRKQATLQESFQRSSTYAVDDPRVKKLNALLVNLICKEGLPFSLLESEAFKMFVLALDPRYKLPTRQAMSAQMIPDRYEEVKSAVVSHLARSGSNASFTTDTWTSSAADAYSAVTPHYINENFNSVNRCIAVRHAPGSHTADLLAAHVTQVLLDFGIQASDRDIHVTTDNGANIKKAMTKVMVNVKWRGCFAHTLQLVVNAGLESKEVPNLGKMLAKARAIVGHFKRSTTASALLHDIQVRHNIVQHKLRQDVPTRWNSQLTMLDRLIEQRTAVTLALSESRGNVPKNMTAHE
jgi:hypothetical protein